MAQTIMVDGDTRYGPVTAWYGAGMAHKLLSAHIIFAETCLPIFELYLEAVFLLYFTGCAAMCSLIHAEVLR